MTRGRGRLAAATCCGWLLAAGPARAADGAAIDAEARRLMARDKVNGLALAVIENGAVTHVAAYGYRNVEKRLPLTTGNVMYGASLTKTAATYMVLQSGTGRRPDMAHRP